MQYFSLIFLCSSNFVQPYYFEYFPGVLLQNAQHFESNTALCKVCTKDNSYIVRCCVKGSLLEVNERLVERPELLISSAEREGYIAIIMPKPADWLKIKASLLGKEDYCKLHNYLGFFISLQKI
nr:protein Simiate [Ipomoea batatas]